MAKYATCPFKVGDILEVRDVSFAPSGLPEKPLIVAKTTKWHNHSGWCVELERRKGELYDVNWFVLNKMGVLKRILNATKEI